MNFNFRKILKKIIKNRLYYKFIEKRQNSLIKKNYSADEKNLILFLVPGINGVSGGIVSIFSIARESQKLKDIHQSPVIMASYPNQKILLKYTKFKNNFYIYRFDQIREYFTELENIIMHVPEYIVPQLLHYLNKDDIFWLKSLKKVHINILNQNIEMMPSVETIHKLKEFSTFLTCTTAHEKYSNKEEQQKLGIPMHRLSVNINNGYYFKPYEQKENIMIVSPDSHPMKEEILNKIKKEFPKLKLKIIEHKTFEKYKELIAKAKWGITFGEGLDGYFAEPAYSGSVSFAVFNTKFFTEDFQHIETVYDSFEILLHEICSDIKRINNKEIYEKVNKQMTDLIYKYYKQDEYLDNIKNFYLGNYDFSEIKTTM